MSSFKWDCRLGYLTNRGAQQLSFVVAYYELRGHCTKLCYRRKYYKGCGAMSQITHTDHTECQPTARMRHVASAQSPEGTQDILIMETRRLLNGDDYLDDDFDVEVRQPSGSFEDVVDSKKSDEEPVKSVPYYRLFRYATCADYVLILTGFIAAAAHGAGLPMLFLFFGKITDAFTTFGIYEACDFNYTICVQEQLYNGTEQQFKNDSESARDLEGHTTVYIYYLAYIASAVLVCATLQAGTFCLQASRQTNRIRVKYVESILRQDIGYHDLNPPGEINSRLSDDIKKIYDGMADKLSLNVQHLVLIVAGLILAFFHSWKLTLVSLAVTPLTIVFSSVFFGLSASYTQKELDEYASAGSIAEETISAIRTVVAFGIQDNCFNRYSSRLSKAQKVGIKRGTLTGVSIGMLYLAMFGSYALTFWYGVRLVTSNSDDKLSPGDMMIVFYNVLLAAFALGTVGGNMEYYSAAAAAGQKIFSVIDRVSPIDILSQTGFQPQNCDGEISFKNVNFSYPSRNTVQILKDVTFSVKKGQTVALVGQSGCGKSTCVSLIQRFYDIQSGSVEVDGLNVQSLNLKWLRDNIGVVAQEPVLFNTTIAENIRWGRDGVSQSDIIKAAKQANAYDFIYDLPKKFDTIVGESGGQLSGGQKQRIAIARAIVRDPKIMLLDEATSALDTESEAVVQSALEKAAAGRTTIVIAHRLSTVRNADRIVAFHEGKVVEEGTHHELMGVSEGVYANLVNMQTDGAEKNAVTPLPEGHEAEFFYPSTTTAAKSVRKPRRHLSSMSSNASAPEHAQQQDVQEADEEEELPDAPMKRMLILNKPEWGYIFFGVVFALMAGSVDSLNAIIFPRVLTVFTIGDKDTQLHMTLIFTLMFLGLGLFSFIGWTMEGFLFSYSGMKLTTRLRQMAFKAILRQDIEYFDDYRNSTGALTTRLATDASRVQACTGARLGTIVKNFSSLAVALTIGFIYGWKLTLVSSSFIPFLILGGFLEMNLLVGEAEREKEAFEESGKIVAEAIYNIRTVASLTKEETIYKNYEQSLSVPARNANRKALVTGIGFGFSQCVMYFAYAGILRYGAYLVQSEELSFENVFRILSAVIFGAMAVGQNSSFAPDYAEGKVSAKRMFALFDTKTKINAYDNSGRKPSKCDGAVDFRSVQFNYPTRPDSLVLRGLDFSALPAKTLALVGQSGCGKSTCIQLIERFYDSDSGAVFLDDNNVKELNVAWHRQQLGIVSQEPVLFDITIKENIGFGDLRKYHSDSEIREAAKAANIHDFILSLPEGYNTRVGTKGTQLSGGQKQRIAIARALLRKPKVLLLDEATSALDTESEKLVQSALDKAMKGRTCIIIAHRLSTVKNADVIVVLDNGAIVETGTHEDLIRHRGAYYSLVNAQLH